jgi:tRNA A64-2'-O-ribosylphosphate transferase
MSDPIKTSDIIFPILSNNLSSTLSDLKRYTLNISNRLHSIREDAEFVSAVADAYDLPLIANERCGGWYIPPERKVESAYFKSTDGHSGQWAFSLRRLNFQVLDVIEADQGCIIVDSTRRGKRMPDALSKTIPVWCAVLNRVLFLDREDSHTLVVPSQSVSESEYTQIEDRLVLFTEQLKSLHLDISQLRKKVSRPLRPFWITRDSGIPTARLDSKDYYPVVLCTASRQVSGAEISENGYIQGAGDDNEGWSRGLTPQLFWENKQTLIDAGEQDLPDIIDQILAAKQDDRDATPIMITPTNWISIAPFSALNSLRTRQYSHLIICERKLSREGDPTLAKRLMHLQCRTGKLGSRDLRKELHKLELSFSDLAQDPRILVVCLDGEDISVGVALAVLCLHADDNGNYSSVAASPPSLSKDLIKRRLSWIMMSFPSANPSRATLQSVNDFLLSPQSTTNGLTDGLSAPPIDNTASSNGLFSQLSGTWQMQRKITNFLQPEFAGAIYGSAAFQPRSPTSEEAQLEYLYSEAGVFNTTLGVKMDVRRRWIWRVSQRGSISVHFVKADSESEDYLYHVLAFDAPSSETWKDAILTARADHPCEADFYKSFYEFHVKAGQLDKIVVKHEVKGPAKDYISKTRYTRSTEDK